MSRNIRKISITFIIIFICLAMYFVEVFLKPGYFLKSIIKVVLFVGLPMIFCILAKQFDFTDYFIIKQKKQIFVSAALGLGVYLIILAGYYILRSFINLDNISMQLENNMNVNKNNFIYVAIYISFINSMLEELFFRGFVFLTLNKTSSKPYSYILSALAFSVYHVSILENWFNIILYITFIAGLFAVGLFFNYLNEKNNNIYNSWIVHMCANLSINTIGFFMFGIL